MGSHSSVVLCVVTNSITHQPPATRSCFPWFGLAFFVLTYIALLLDTDRDNVEWAWTLALFVLLVLAHCRTITLRIGWNSPVFH
jgi:hypothetical protein